MSEWKFSDLSEFYEDAARQHDIHDALARDIIKTLPEGEWPVWVRNRMRMWIDPVVPIKLPNPDHPDRGQTGLTFPAEWLARHAAIAWPPCPGCGKLAGFEPYAFARGFLQCNNCHGLYTPKQLADALNGIMNKHRDQLDEWTPLSDEEPGDTTFPSEWLAKLAIALEHGEYDFQTPLTKDQIVTQCMLCGKFMQRDGSWAEGNPMPGAPVSHSICPQDWVKQPGMENVPYIVAHFKTAAGLGIPADYTPDDPYDIAGKMPLINSMHVDWYSMPPDQAEQVIVNAFRATMLSPRMNLRSNAILYQLLMDVPAHESDPDVFEQKIRSIKAQWDAQGQGQLGQEPEEISDPSQFLPGKLHSGFWGNIRRLAGLGPYIDDIYKAAMDDMAQGGDGHIFRQRVVDLNIPGVGMKVASFAWLALAPKTSELGTIDVHMMRHLNQAGDSPTTDKQYLALENQLRQERDEMYGTEVPLSHYQWAVWDARRTPGYHQDHTPLRAYQPTPYGAIAWPPTARPPRTRQPDVPEGQQSLLGKWVRMPAWKIYAANAYTIQGKIVAGAPGVQAQGTVVRPDRQSEQEIMEIINGLYTHGQDAIRQRQMIPEWVMNRGGKVADFQQGPGGTGVTYGGSVICVSEWVDVKDNWLLEHPACRGIVAQKGGAASHGVVVARARNIAIVVDVPEAAKIQPGDTVQLDPKNAIIHVNGGSTEDFGEAQQADTPIIRFVWSRGVGLTAPVPQEDPEGGTLHAEMIRQQYRNGQWDMSDNALGIIYEDGKVQMLGQPSDQEAMVQWLNTIHPITTIENGFQM